MRFNVREERGSESLELCQLYTVFPLNNHPHCSFVSLCDLLIEIALLLVFALWLSAVAVAEVSFVLFWRTACSEVGSKKPRSKSEAIFFLNVEKPAGCVHAYPHVYLTWIYACLHFLCRSAQACLTPSPSPPRVVLGFHPSSCLPHTLALHTLGWSVIHFLILCIAIIKGGSETRFPHENSWHIFPLAPLGNISNQGGKHF